MTTSDIALLVLEDGTVFKGRAWGARGRTLGEIVFSTGMTGYQEKMCIRDSIYPYRVYSTTTRPQAYIANKQDATRSIRIALTVDQMPYIAPFDASS